MDVWLPEGGKSKNQQNVSKYKRYSLTITVCCIHSHEVCVCTRLCVCSSFKLSSGNYKKSLCIFDFTPDPKVLEQLFTCMTQKAAK